MIKSMTAFASVEKTVDTITVDVEIRSVNSKGLDLNMRLPHGYQILEDKVRTFVPKYLARGRVDIRIKIQAEDDEIFAFEVNEAKARALIEALSGLKHKFDLPSEIPIDLFTGPNGVISAAEIEQDPDKIWEVMEDCLRTALKDLVKMREDEGAFLAKDFEERLAYLEKSVVEIEKSSADLVPMYQERLKERITTLTNGVAEIDESRLAQEVAFMADKSDISEEVVRAKSHISQFRSLIASEEPAGRKLNFLLQEFNREFNTMGSKVGNADISHVIVDLKSEIEKIREQVQNVE
ncbi:MAG: YicC family protein [Desulfobacterales bacterium]|nr:YicC family protein [Desulfobacterales bacterium]